MHNLHRFLLFARGQYTGLFGVTGLNAGGAAIYEEWGMRLSTLWELRLGWFDVHHGQSLAQVYPGFISLLGDADLGDGWRAPSTGTCVATAAVTEQASIAGFSFRRQRSNA